MRNFSSKGIQRHHWLRHHTSKLTCATLLGVQVQADSNFADLGADSLDTVSRAAIHSL